MSNQKPSERIEEIKKILPKNYGGDIYAIMKYLDEEWEKVQPCPHNKSVDKGGGVRECNDCKALYSES